MSDQLVPEAATYTTYNKHKRRTSMPSVGFELAITTIKRVQTHALDRTATGLCHVACRPTLVYVRKNVAFAALAYVSSFSFGLGAI
jgi:hypothetical protein